ncbi:MULTISPECIES: FKBP-type peptidyl-prolyl cis-trans isomerase [unclassified Colwellia]|jgi:peptidylprolyl isomerase|uniref:FKBP-type peptidyl-prolyl cis-trans isomerase n=1 Tax=unclassified Colwellia TaxID=196834 RepID=UPI000D3D9FD2|nr:MULTISPECIES: FKBP-type peptidyl-prolyl cis-trans isomerase [unclassified Colwellia]AWB58879.1 peptidylprolyl isomerase [Colwellia sp. Arc7-D]MBA6417251.1 FKBP-type peptidyl-prolyl cis-trans isomerase [Colwellia sp. 6M3]
MTKYILLIIVLGLIVSYFIRSNANQEAAKVNALQAEQFLQKNKQLEGVIETDSGLQYQVLSAGDGETHPVASSKVKVHYHGTLLDGTVFDSSVERNQPISFGLNQVIKGWTEGLQLMVTGEKTRLFIPAALGYGNSATGKIPAGALLIFDVELLAID